MFVSGITRENGRDKISEARTALNQAVANNASDKEIKDLAQMVVNIEATLKSIETREQNAYSKMTEKDKLIVNARHQHAEEIYQKEKDDRAEAERKREEEKRKAEELEKKRLEEQERRQQERWDSIHNSVIKFGNTISGAVNSIADASFHALLGPLNLLVNPLEKALNFNLFNLGKKTVEDILTMPIKSRYDLEKKGGLIGATGIFIADTITKALGKSRVLEESDSGTGSLWENIKDKVGSVIGGAATFAAPVLGALGIVAAGVAVAWANEWDKKGPEVVDEYLAVMDDPNADLWTKFKADLKFACDKIIKGFFGGVAGAIRNFSENKTEIDSWLFGEDGPQGFFENAISSVLAFGKGETDVWAQYNAALARYIKAINDPSSDLYYKMQALRILDPNSPLFDDKIDTEDLAYMNRVMNGWTEYGQRLWSTASELSGYLEKGYSANLVPGSNMAYTLYDKDGNLVRTPEQEAIKGLEDYMVHMQVQKAEIYAEELKTNAESAPIPEEQVNALADALVEATKEGTALTFDEAMRVIGKTPSGSKPVYDLSAAINSSKDSIIPREAFENLELRSTDIPGTNAYAVPFQIPTDLNGIISLLQQIVNNTGNTATPVVNNISSGTPAMNFEGMRL